MVREPCCICGTQDQYAHIVITNKLQVVCWQCVTDAVEYYKEEMK